MPLQDDSVLQQLDAGPATPRALMAAFGLSQPSLSRLMARLDTEVLRIGAGKATRYARRDRRRGLPDIAVYRVDAAGRVARLGQLVPIRPDGFAMFEGSDPHARYSVEGLPWWLYDMRPQGFLGRAYAGRHAATLGLPPQVTAWSDTDALRALLAHGHDATGNLLLGDDARAHFLQSADPQPLAEANKTLAYVALAELASRGEVPGSSAGGEQPKFLAYADSADSAVGPAHLLVKYSATDDNPISQRWRDLLLAEHLAQTTLAQAGIAAAATTWRDIGSQRFLEVARFDRVGMRGRRGLMSLAALDAEFTGLGNANWPTLARALATTGAIDPGAVPGVDLLWAFGTLIGNTDMHNGNLSWLTENGRPYRLAPAYDMTPMGFAPGRSGALPSTLHPAQLVTPIDAATWRRAAALAHDWLERLRATPALSQGFNDCLAALRQHLAQAEQAIARLA